MRRNEIMGAVHFPRKMEADIKSRKPTTVTLYTNAAYLVPAKLIYKDAAQVLLTGGSGCNIAEAGENRNESFQSDGPGATDRCIHLFIIQSGLQLPGIPGARTDHGSDPDDDHHGGRVDAEL